MTLQTPFYADEAVTIWHGNALALPIPDESVDLVVTSPPYFGLRSYTDAGEHYDGQIGCEATPAEFVDALIAATAEMVRVLKPSGSIWINLGDKYNSAASGQNGTGKSSLTGPHDRMGGSGRACARIPTKSLMGLPWRYAIRCIDELGLILRAEVIWSKPNGLPESVTDRVRRSHEQWFHFTREPRYFSAVDEIRDPNYVREPRPNERLQMPGGGMQGQRNIPGRSDYGQPGSKPSEWNALGKLPGSVWEIPTQPLTVPAHLGVDHFAAFPMEWPRRIIRGWSPSGICVECGEGRRPVRESEGDTPRQRLAALGGTDRHVNAGGQGLDFAGAHTVWRTHRITGYACACNAPIAPIAPTRPGVVLDPFGGTGTTALIARSLGRIGWHVDLSADYCRLAQWRVTDTGELARAMEVEKPPPAPEDMDSLFDLLEDGAA